MPNPMFVLAFQNGAPSPTTTTPPAEDDTEEGEEESPHKKWRRLPESKPNRSMRTPRGAVVGCRR